MRIRVIGVGTRRGDDAAGLAVAKRLNRAPLPASVSVVECERPGLDLLDELAGTDVVVLVDAMQSGEPAGTVQRIPARSLHPRRDFSSHGLGVAETLDLATALGRLPPRVEIVGIERGAAADGELSPAVERGVRAAVAQIQTLIGELGAC